MSVPVVIIEVHDGVVYCAQKPVGVAVIFRDWNPDDEDVLVESTFAADAEIAQANSEEVVAAAKVLTQLAEIERHVSLTEMQIADRATCKQTFDAGFRRIPR